MNAEAVEFQRAAAVLRGLNSAVIFVGRPVVTQASVCCRCGFAGKLPPAGCTLGAPLICFELFFPA